LGSREEPPSGEALYRQAIQALKPNFCVSDELSGGDEHPPGNANQFWFNFDTLDVLG